MSIRLQSFLCLVRASAGTTFHRYELGQASQDSSGHVGGATALGQAKLTDGDEAGPTR